MCTHSYFTVDSHRKITSLPLVGKLTKLEFRGRKNLGVGWYFLLNLLVIIGKEGVDQYFYIVYPLYNYLITQKEKKCFSLGQGAFRVF